MEVQKNCIYRITSVPLYSARNLEMSIRFSLKSRPSERFHRPEMSQIKAEISLCTNAKLDFHKNVGCQWYQWIPDFYNIRFWANLFNGKKICGLKSYVIKIRESIDIIAILHFYDKSTSPNSKLWLKIRSPNCWQTGFRYRRQTSALECRPTSPVRSWNEKSFHDRPGDVRRHLRALVWRLVS